MVVIDDIKMGFSCCIYVVIIVLFCVFLLLVLMFCWLVFICLIRIMLLLMMILVNVYSFNIIINLKLFCINSRFNVVFMMISGMVKVMISVCW